MSSKKNHCSNDIEIKEAHCCCMHEHKEEQNHAHNHEHIGEHCEDECEDHCHHEHKMGCGCCSTEESDSVFARLSEHLEKPIYLIVSFVALLANVLLSFIITGKGHNHGVVATLAWYDYLSIIAVVLSGFPIVYAGLYNFFIKRRIKSSLLITIAIFASVYIGELFTAGEVALLMAFGEYLENRTVRKAKQGISRLMSMVPSEVSVLDNGVEISKSISKVQIGEVVKIRPGETIALDGIVVNGSSAIDQSNITGESIPVDVHKDSRVYSGSVNTHGTIDIQVINLANNSSMQRMIKLMNMADSSKSNIENIADKWSAWLVPIALVIAVLVYIITGDIVRMVSVLVVFCPCAFALATPTCIVAAIGNASKKGVLIKNKNAVEYLAKSDLFAFDKTGTLTTGKLNVSEIVPLSDMDTHSIMQIAASLEYHSEHPLAKAIVRYAKQKDIALLDVHNFRAIAGIGIDGSIDGVLYSITKATHSVADKLASDGKATMMLSREGEELAIIALADEIKQNAPDTITRLASQGVDSILLSGDNAMACKNIATKLNIKHFKAALMPEQKLESIAELRRKHVVTMVGDGMNDAPALKSADVSVSMADSGSDISVEASDIVLLGDDVGKLPYVKRLSTITLHNIKINLTVAMGINLVAVVLSVLGLLSPVLGALVHNLGSVFVTLNATRLYGMHIDE